MSSSVKNEDSRSTLMRYVSSSITLEGAREYAISARLLFLDTMLVVKAVTVSIGNSATGMMLVIAAGSLLSAVGQACSGAESGLENCDQDRTVVLGSCAMRKYLS
jgi:hypothetical protein